MTTMKQETKRVIAIALTCITVALISINANAQMPNIAKGVVVAGRGINTSSRIKPKPIPPITRPIIPSAHKDTFKVPKPKISSAPVLELQQRLHPEKEKQLQQLMVDYGQLETGKLAEDTLAPVRIAERAIRAWKDSIAEDCLMRFVNTPPTIPQLAYALDSVMTGRLWVLYTEYVASNGVIRNYITCVNNGIPEFKPGDAMFEKFLSDQKLLVGLATKYRPSMTPLAMIPSNLYLGDSLVAPLFHDAIKYMVKFPKYYPSDFQQRLCEDGSGIMLGGGMDSAMLVLFKEPKLAAITNTSFPVAWNLYLAAFQNSDDKTEQYYSTARQLNTYATDSMANILYNNILDEFICHPDTNLVEFVVANASDPFIQTSVLCDTLIATLPVQSDTYEKSTAEEISNMKPYMESIIAMVNLVSDSLKNDFDSDLLRFYKLVAENALGYPTACDDLQIFIDKCVRQKKKPEYTEMIPAFVSVYASIKADGLDKPDVGLKVMNKYLKYAENPVVPAGTRKEYYDYMSALYDRFGKKKQAEKYKKKADAEI